MDDGYIKEKLLKLEKLINYKFSNLDLLKNAMRSIKVKSSLDGKNHKEYSNEKLALIGDAVLKLVIADKLYQDDVTSKGEITNRKKSLENNNVLSKVAKKYHIIDYAYNELHFNDEENIPDHEKVSCNNHDPYIEAIVGAIFYDSDYYVVRNWILTWLYDKLDKFSKQLR